MTQFSYSSGKSPNAQLTEGDYKVMITKADIASVQGIEKLIVDFTLENGEVRTEFIKPETWITLFTDLLDASGQEFSEGGGEFDTDYLIGLEGTLRIIKNEGKGKHEGKTFYNAERFIATKSEQEAGKKN